MTPEERAMQLAKKWYNSDFWVEDDGVSRDLAALVAAAISAAVDEAVAGEREACAVQLDEAASHYRSAANNEIVAMALEVEATAIRARSRGEGGG